MLGTEWGGRVVCAQTGTRPAVLDAVRGCLRPAALASMGGCTRGPVSRVCVRVCRSVPARVKVHKPLWGAARGLKRAFVSSRRGFPGEGSESLCARVGEPRGSASCGAGSGSSRAGRWPQMPFAAGSSFQSTPKRHLQPDLSAGGLWVRAGGRTGARPLSRGPSRGAFVPGPQANPWVLVARTPTHRPENPIVSRTRPENPFFPGRRENPVLLARRREPGSGDLAPLGLVPGSGAASPPPGVPPGTCVRPSVSGPPGSGRGSDSCRLSSPRPPDELIVPSSSAGQGRADTRARELGGAAPLPTAALLGRGAAAPPLLLRRLHPAPSPPPPLPGRSGPSASTFGFQVRRGAGEPRAGFVRKYLPCPWRRPPGRALLSLCRSLARSPLACPAPARAAPWTLGVLLSPPKARAERVYLGRMPGAFKLTGTRVFLFVFHKMHKLKMFGGRGGVLFHLFIYFARKALLGHVLFLYS